MLILVIGIMRIALFNRKFLSGKFKTMIHWLLITFYFIALPYTLLILRDIGLFAPWYDLISYFIYSLMIVVGLCLVQVSQIFKELSDVFGFAEEKGKIFKKK